MNCNDAEMLMNLTVDGMISFVDEIKLKEHLKECPSCRRKMAQLRDLKSQMNDLETEVPSDLHKKIMSAVMPKKKLKIKIGGLAVAACLVIALGGVIAPRLDRMFIFTSQEAPQSAEADLAVPTEAPIMEEAAAGSANTPILGFDYKGMKSEAQTEAQYDLREMPALAVNDSAAVTKEASISGEYAACYAYFGNCEIPDAFGKEELAYYPQKNETHIIVSKDREADAIKLIEDAGFSHYDGYDFGEISENADNILIVILGE